MANPKSHVYGSTSALLADPLDWLHLPLRMTLHGRTCRPRSTDAVFGDVASSELPTAKGYRRGGKSLTGRFVKESATGIHFGAGPISWQSGPRDRLSARCAILSIDTGDPWTSPLLWRCDFGWPRVSAWYGGTFEVAPGERGLIELLKPSCLVAA